MLKKGKHARYCGSLTHFRPPPRMIDIHPQRRLTLQRTKGRKEATWAHIPSFPPPLPWVELLANVTLMLPRRVTAERTFRTKKHRKEGRKDVEVKSKNSKKPKEQLAMQSYISLSSFHLLFACLRSFEFRPFPRYFECQNEGQKLSGCAAFHYALSARSIPSTSR